MGKSNLIGALSSSISAWIDIESFHVASNALTGSLPKSIGNAWLNLTYFDVHDNQLEAAPLPALPFNKMPFHSENWGPHPTGCFLMDGTSAFTCPWPAHAEQNCMKCNVSGGCAGGKGMWVRIKNSDCTAVPVPTSNHGAALAGGLCAAALLLGILVLRQKKHMQAWQWCFPEKSTGIPLLGTSASTSESTSEATCGYGAPAVVAMESQESVVSAPKRTRSVEFTLAQIQQATENFAEHLKLAEGAFGAVYRGSMRATAVAVKVLTRQDEPDAAHSDYSGANSFALEAKVLGQYRHANIVGLIGHCLGPEQPQQFLVYEFMPGGSLLNRLNQGAAAALLTWQERHIVASDAARGLEYLHVEADPPIIHQDIKSDNILLAEYDGHFVAKIADFGAVRIAPALLTSTHYSALDVIGTKPYQPPEYTGQGHVSEKTDTFAFGVVLLELLTAKPPSNKDTSEFLYAELEPVVRLASKLLPPLLDARAGKWPRKKALALAKIAQKCLEMFPHNRCAVRDVLVELDVLAGRKAVVRAGRGEEYDPMTGKLVKTDIARPGCTKQWQKHKAAGTR
jgi:hypothetical protein